MRAVDDGVQVELFVCELVGATSADVYAGTVFTDTNMRKARDLRWTHPCSMTRSDDTDSSSGLLCSVLKVVISIVDQTPAVLPDLKSDITSTSNGSDKWCGATGHSTHLLTHCDCSRERGL